MDGEEVQEAATLIGKKSSSYCKVVVELPITSYVVARGEGPGFGVKGAENNLIYPCLYAQPCTHEAGLESNV